ncbi:hypothetical protein F4809DRAFT_623992 [Biscogniauxia mediterranea]|nr:hypothetical protein F4809DRAFT_623992 [Biscogniauxia mediterranea]
MRRSSNDEESNGSINPEPKENGRKRSVDTQIQSEADDNFMPQMPILTRPNNPMERPIKRQRGYEAGQSQGPQPGPKQGLKISHSMSQYFTSPIEDAEIRYESAYQHPESGSQRGGPLKRKPTTLTTYGSQSTVTASTDSQESSTVKPDLSRDIKEESQESQDKRFKVD